MRNLRFRVTSYLSRYLRDRRIKKLIPREGLVLEIGSGNNPLSCSDVLLDKYVSTTKIHRTGSGSIAHSSDKFFILGDGNSLPFKDNSFSLVICRHVIEHVENPAMFIMELQRVGVSGYLEWPSITTELISGGFGRQKWIRELFPSDMIPHLEDLEHGQGTPGHRWLVMSSKQRIYFLAKSMALYPVYLMLGKYAKATDKRYKKLISEKIAWRIWSPGTLLKPVVIGVGEDNAVADSLREQYDIQEQISSLEKMPPPTPAQEEGMKSCQKLFQCPDCRKGGLDRHGLLFICSACRREYSVVNGIPVLLPDEF